MKEDLIDGIFPNTSLGQPRPDGVSDDEWINYLIGTWCLNSFNASVDGGLRIIKHAYHKDANTPLKDVIHSEGFLESMAINANRLENVCHWLWEYWRETKGLK